MYDTCEKELLKYMPKKVNEIILKAYTKRIEEVRLRVGLPLCIYMDGESFIAGESGVVASKREGYIVTKEDISESLLKITKSSYYSFENEIKNGFVTLDGGHRIGIGGRGVMTGGEVVSICDVSSLNFRFARQIFSCAEDAIRIIKNGKSISNTLIISPPGCGKTTMLREIMRRLSDIGFKVCALDERNELCAMRGGEAGYDIGINTDVYCGLPKTIATAMAIRCLAPQILIMDELGTSEDLENIRYAASCGVSVVATMHGKSIADVKRKFKDEEILNCFECYIYLGENKKIIRNEKKEAIA